MDSCIWTHFNNSMQETSLVYASKDYDGSTIVIGRAHHSGDLIPGKVLLRDGTCHISHNGKEYSHPNFEVLMNSSGFKWQACSNGNIPQNAVVGGKTSSGETLYIGRAQNKNLIIPGKIQPSHRCLYLASNWLEHSKTNYEVLVKSHDVPSQIMKKGIEWVHWKAGYPWPENAVIGGVFNQNVPQYVARRAHGTSIIIGYAYRSGSFYSGINGKEVSYTDFELLVNHSGICPRDL